VTRFAAAVPGGASADGEFEGLEAVPGTTSYTADACNRVYVTQLVQTSALAGTVRRLTTMGQCFPPPEACTVSGTAGNDTLTGTDGRDVICGGGGNDKLVGLAGDDLLSSGAGNDTSSSGPTTTSYREATGPTSRTTAPAHSP
jgi:Ca2+-binding RTX toxin-like protein